MSVAVLSQACIFTSIPDELLVLIASECECRGVIRLRQTSKYLDTISRHRQVWLALLERLTQEWGISFAQFQPFHPRSTSASDFERAVTAHYRLYSLMGNEIIDKEVTLPLLFPRTHLRIEPPESYYWTASSLSLGGQWIAAIFGQTLRIYDVSGDLNKSYDRQVIAEHEIAVLSTSDLLINWTSPSGEFSTIEIEEAGRDDVIGCRFWVFHIRDCLNRTNHQAPPLELFFRGILDVEEYATFYHDGPSDPSLVSYGHNDSCFLWYPDGHRIYLDVTEIHSREMTYSKGFIMTISLGQITLWAVPSVSVPSGSSLIQPLPKLVPQHIHSFDQISELNWVVDNVQNSQEENFTFSNEWCISSISPSFSWSSTSQNLTIPFIRIIRARPTTSATPQPVHRYTYLFSKTLHVRRDPKDSHILSYRPDRAAPQHVQTLPLSDGYWANPTLSGNWMIKSHRAVMPARNEEPWDMMVYGSLDGNYLKDRGAKLAFKNTGYFEVDDPELCTFSGRGLVCQGDQLHVLEFV
ncbi:hypothetical protein DL96DRAFT_1626555 [Flagelloscypha sp. PMI_526]|nr:hypothetical protein DL96DRAFT_1626555 [Flagelloscypha sp. PMI_526]